MSTRPADSAGAPPAGPVAILAPAGRDAAVIAGVLARAGIGCSICASVAELAAELDGAGAVVLAEEALRAADRQPLIAWLARQPAWSDLPILLLTAHASAADPRLVEALGNVTPLERPLHAATLVGAVRAALRVRARQRRAAAQVEELARTQAALREETRSLETLNRVGALLAAEFDPARLIQVVTDAATELSGARYGAFLQERSGEEGGGDGACVLRALSGPPCEALFLPVSRAAPLLEQTFRGEGIVRLADVTCDGRSRRGAPCRGVRPGAPRGARRGPRPGQPPLRAYLAVPVVSRSGSVIGGLVFGHPDPGVFTERSERLVAAIAGYAAIALDNARLLEEARRANEALECRVAERTAELEAANRRLRQEVAAREAAQAQLAQAQKMEALGQLAGGIAHDFNNALQAVAGGARLIAKRPGDAEAVARIARMVAEAAERGGSVARRLLAFARRDELRSEAVDAAALLGDLREVLAHTLGPSVAVALAVPQGLPPLRADRGQLETVLVNLATNARDAMPGGGTLTFALAVEEVVAQGPRGPATPGHYLRLDVTDTGEGIRPELLGRVAEPFFTTKPRGRGTGLGLAMARGFAEQSGGAFAIASEVGVGTTVTLWLPVAEAAADAAPAAAPVAAPAGDHGCGAADAAGPAAPAAGEDVPRHVLLVEDEALVRSVLAAELRAQGHTVAEAEGAEAALDLLRSGAPVDLLVTDLAMPGTDGLALVREARQVRRGLPALLLTGYAGDGSALALDEAGRGGPFALARKPVAPAELSARMAALLSRAVRDGGRAQPPPLGVAPPRGVGWPPARRRGGRRPMPDGATTGPVPPGAQPGLVRDRLTAPGVPSPRSVFVDAPNMPWEETKFPGIRMKMLFNDGRGMSTMLLKMEPGAVVPLHEHTAIEQSYVLEGRFVDEEGECLPGQFVWRPEGNTHIAWAGPEGALVLGIFLRPNIFADGRKHFSEEQRGS